MKFIDIWHELRDSVAGKGSAEAGQLRLRQIQSWPDCRLFASVGTHDFRPGLVLELPRGALGGVSEPPPGRRLRAILQPTVQGPYSWVVVELKDKAFIDLFGILADDICRAVEAAPAARVAVTAMQVFERWFRFMDREQPSLTDAEVKGLIGELAVLRRLVGRMGAEAAVDAWASPNSAIRDFEASDRTIEVKAFSPSTGSVVRIYDPIQLEPDPGKALYLACQALGPSDSPAHRLGGHVERVDLAIGKHDAARERFHILLAKAGYVRGSDDLYPRAGWRLGELHAFEVRGGFPRIAPSDVPTGVEAVAFSVSLEAAKAYAVDAVQVIGPSPDADPEHGSG